MSWDATLFDDEGSIICEINFTHNCNKMANAIVPCEVLRSGGIRWWLVRGREDVVNEFYRYERTGTWWQYLDDLQGFEGAIYLNGIIRGLKEDPQRFRAMNPKNGWGSYDSFLRVLTEMRDATPEAPCRWRVSG